MIRRSVLDADTGGAMAAGAGGPIGRGRIATNAGRVITGAGGAALVGSDADHVCAEIDAPADASSAPVVYRVGIAVSAGCPVARGRIAASACRVIAGSRHVTLVQCRATHVRAQIDAGADTRSAFIVDGVGVAVIAGCPVASGR